MPVSRVGLVLGGGGITGAAFQFGALLTLQLATGWNPNSAEVVIGTSCGALTGAMVRGDQLNLHTFVGDAELARGRRRDLATACLQTQSPERSCALGASWRTPGPATT